MARPEVFRRDLSAYYLFTFGGMGAILPFLPILLASQGLSPKQVGWVMLLGPLGNLLAPPAWGWLADAFSARLALMRFLGLGCAVGALSFLVDASFGWSLFAMGLFSLFRAPLIPLADSAAHAMLGEEAHDFAHIRLWGSLGFATFAFGVGQLDGSGNPIAMLGLTAGAYALTSVCTARFKAPKLQRRVGVLRETLSVVRRPRLLVLFGASALHYVAHGSYDVYFGLHMRALGHGDAFVGVAWMVAVFAEIALMWVAPKLLQGRSGEGFLVLAALASVLRWALLGSVESQSAILSAQVLHAFTFGLWYLALVRYIQMRAPEGVRSTVQSTLHATHGLGMMVGYLVGGDLFEAGGGADVFDFAVAAALAGAALYAALWWRAKVYPESSGLT